MAKAAVNVKAKVKEATDKAAAKHARALERVHTKHAKDLKKLTAKGVKLQAAGAGLFKLINSLNGIIPEGKLKQILSKAQSLQALADAILAAIPDPF